MRTMRITATMMVDAEDWDAGPRGLMSNFGTLLAQAANNGSLELDADEMRPIHRAIPGAEHITIRIDEDLR